MAPVLEFSALLTFVLTNKSTLTPEVFRSISKFVALVAVTVNRLFANPKTVLAPIPEVPFAAES